MPRSLRSLADSSGKTQGFFQQKTHTFTKSHTENNPENSHKVHNMNKVPRNSVKSIVKASILTCLLTLLDAIARGACVEMKAAHSRSSLGSAWVSQRGVKCLMTSLYARKEVCVRGGAGREKKLDCEMLSLLRDNRASL